MLMSKAKTALSAAIELSKKPEVREALGKAAIVIGKNVTAQVAATIATHYTSKFLKEALGESAGAVKTVIATAKAVEETPLT